MSGEVVAEVELARPDDALIRLVRVLARLGPGSSSTPFALVGGLAVMARLGQRHRATEDVDTVYAEGPAGTGLRAVLVAAGATVTATGFDIEGVKIDTIEVDVIRPDQLPDELGPRSFVLAHRWALDSATPVRLVVRPSGGREPLAVVLPTATTPALLAMKLHSFPDRRRKRPEKQVSDLHDLYRLLVSTDVPTLRSAFAASPFDLPDVCGALARRMIEDNVTDTVRALSSAARQLPAVTLEEFATALETLLSAIG